MKIIFNVFIRLFIRVFKSLSYIARIVFVFWSICSLFVISSKELSFFQKNIVIVFGYIFYCGIAHFSTSKIEKWIYKKRHGLSKQKEAELKEKWQQQEIEKQKRIEQCNSFKIEDMYQFVNVPFEWQYVDSLFHTNGKAWFMLNTNNQYVAYKYIDILDKLISEFRECNSDLKHCEIFMEEIDFMYQYPMHKYSVANTYVECLPYTKTGKKSKYPVVLHFASSVIKDNSQTHPCMGEIKIMQDGNIGSATVTFAPDYTKFTFGLHGINLIIKRIDCIGGKIYKFDD